MTSINIDFKTNKEDFYNDYLDVIKSFYPYVRLVEGEDLIELQLNKVSDTLYNCIIIDFKNSKNNSKLDIKIEISMSELEIKSKIKKFSKIQLYELLSLKSGIKLPYGSLTGIRPTKLYYQIKEQGFDARKVFIDEFKVSEEKAKLIDEICTNQEKYIVKDFDIIDLFVNIPICVSRCSYCSFLSAELGKIKNLVQPYCDLLVLDIISAKQTIKDLGLKVKTIYVGGGTPTSINALQLDSILSQLSDIDCEEFTVEAGRPDTIDLDKLKVMQKNGVTRISINPQTFNQKTLDLIGRKHTVEDIYNKFEMARMFDFDINMDLIAMLPNENLEDFINSVDKAIELDPENITIHTLALKRGSKLKDEHYSNVDVTTLTSQMIQYSQDKILKSGYKPYYMYKQKYVSGNLENIGYCKPNAECIYNIDIMEEIHTILACGAGGISKILHRNENVLERLPNPKGLDVYLDRNISIFENRDLIFKEKLSKK